MHKIKAFLAFIFSGLLQTSFCTLPPGIKKCRFGNTTCLIESSNQVIRLYPQGVPELGVPALDRIHIDDTTLLTSPGPVSISYRLFNQVLKGLENATVTNITGFERNPGGTNFEISLRIPRILQQGNYQFQGSGLIVYSNSSGVSSSDLQNVRLSIKLKVYLEFRNNKRYLKILDVMPQLKFDRWILQLDNIYKENTDLSVILNRVVNENWLEFWNEIEPILLPVYTKSIKQNLDAFANSTPYDDLFLAD